jgi:hypothetical protein
MTEKEWLKCSDPTSMLEFLRERISDRQIRLFLCGCARQIWHLLLFDNCKAAVVAAEQFADGQIAGEVLAEAAQKAKTILATQEAWPTGIHYAMTAVVESTQSMRDADGEFISFSRFANESAALAKACGPQSKPDFRKQVKRARAEQCFLLRDICGDPFHPVTLDPRWQTSTVIDLGKAMYDERAFDRMPILADALMDAGCDSEEIIAHCRSEGPHVRGCWVVDLLLAKQ